MRIVEREPALAVLCDAVRDRGSRVVLVSGEAGAGKSSLVRALVSQTPGSLLGRCVDLRTARPLAPIIDWLGVHPGQDVLGQVSAVLAAVPLAVIEDLHWADDATLDLLAQVVQRSPREAATLVLTYRDGEVAATHPLRLLLADLAALSPLRLTVPALTARGVSQLADGSGLDAGDLLARTGGNAFLVTECITAGSLDVTDGIRDAVMGRLVRLGPAVREAVEAVACVPGGCEPWLAQALGAMPDALDAAVGHGLLTVEADGRVCLRHELTRRAVEQGIPVVRRQRLHQQAAAALTERPGPTDDSRVVHHALLADRGDAGLAPHAVRAAERALAVGSLSQAVACLEIATACAPTDPDVARWWELLAQQRVVLGDLTGATTAYANAIAATDDPVRAAVLRVHSCRPLTGSGHGVASRLALREGLAVLEQVGSREGLAIAYATACSEHMLARELEQAVRWGQQARALAHDIGDVRSEATACIQQGVAAWMSGDPEGLTLLRSGIVLAEHHGLVDVVGHGYVQIGSGGGEIRAYSEALPALERALAHADEHGLADRYAQAWWGRCLVETGRWDLAAQVLTECLRSRRTDAISRLTALTALGRLRSRRGDPGVADVLDEALDLAEQTAHLQRLWPVAAARAEHGWLSGDLSGEVSLLERAHAMAQDLDYPWAGDELAFWLQRADRSVTFSGRTPYDGERDAAERWRQLGCPYEQAEALVASGRELEGLSILERLGAAPLHRYVVDRRRRAGLRVPRGPNTRTRGTPGGLTDRELEVLRSVAAGWTNAQIASALHISPKTAGHHVSHLLDKLQVRSRAGAVTRAAQLGIELSET